MHTNETHSVANLQDLIPTLAAIIIGNTKLLAKVGIKSCRFATGCVSFVHVWMQLANQLELCLHEQTQIVASAACRVGSQEFHSWIASLPLVSLLFIVIPTPFLNFLNFIYIYILFVYFLLYNRSSLILFALRLGTSRLRNLVMRVPRPLFELRRFVFVLQYKS